MCEEVKGISERKEIMAQESKEQSSSGPSKNITKRPRSLVRTFRESKQRTQNIQNRSFRSDLRQVFSGVNFPDHNLTHKG